MWKVTKKDRGVSGVEDIQDIDVVRTVDEYVLDSHFYYIYKLQM